MSLKILISGFGSIGLKHAKIVKEIFPSCSLAVFSKRNIKSYKKIYDVKDIINFNPDYIIISSYTSEHFKQLKFFNKLLSNKKILVEKPLYENLYNKNIIVKNKIYVGYNLRFHPLIKLIKKLTHNKILWNYQVFCGSYLPSWRKTNYTISSSSKKKYGGGVLLDLSHEIDYSRLIIGDFNISNLIFKKISNLKIETEDLLLASGTYKKTHIHISLNYFSRFNLRQIIIDGKGISICADLNSNKAIIFINGKKYNYKSKKTIERTYYDMHKSILNDRNSSACSYKDALKTQKIIENFL